MMENKWTWEDFEYNERTASWCMKGKWLLADYPIKFEIQSAAFKHDTPDRSIINEFITYLQQRQERIKDDIHRIAAIVDALAAVNSDPLLQANKLQLGGVVLKKYAESGYRFTYDYLFSADNRGKIYPWVAFLKDGSITGVAKS